MKRMPIKDQQIVEINGWRTNWKNPNEYPIPETTTPEMWAWEFVRRNESYQKDFAKYNGLEKIIANDEQLRGRLSFLVSIVIIQN